MQEISNCTANYSILGDRYLSIIPIDSGVTQPKSNQTAENRVIGQNGDRAANKAGRRHPSFA